MVERDGGRTRSMCGVLNTVKSLSFKGSGTVSRGSLSFLDRYACIAMFFYKMLLLPSLMAHQGPYQSATETERPAKQPRQGRPGPPAASLNGLE